MKTIARLIMFCGLLIVLLVGTVITDSFGEVKKKGKKQQSQAPAPAQVMIEKDDVLSKMGNDPNAKFMKVYDHEGAIQLLIPDDIATYDYLNHYPLSAFIFVTLCDQQYLSNLTVKDLMKGYLRDSGFYDILSFNRIKGFEDISAELKKLDEFSVAARKTEIISKLIDCYKNYYRDYERYLKGVRGYYVFKNPTTEDHYGGHPWLSRGEVKPVLPVSFLREISRNNYNFDNKQIEISTFGLDGLPIDQSWGYAYMDRFYKSYKNSKLVNPNFPQSIAIPMSIDNAKKLFGDQQKAFCETLFTVKPLHGLFERLNYKVSNFDIYKITKKCYREDTGFNDPVLIFEFTSTKDKPFH